MQPRSPILIALALLAATLPACTRITPDPSPSFTLDPQKPFTLARGRGSGWHGLETVTIDHTGLTTINRMTYTRDGDTTHIGWETTHLTLTPAQLAELAATVNIRRLTALASSYSDPHVQDGTQWVFTLTQGAHKKAIYFNNAFPDSITTFAADLDALLTRAHLPAATWRPSERADQPLWDALH